MPHKWQIELSEEFIKSVAAITRSEQIRITSFLQRLERSPDPLFFGKRLTGKLKHLWRFRVGNYRLIADVKRHVLTIIFIHSGHRKDVYKKL